MEQDRPHQRTFDQGRAEAMELAFATLVKLLPDKDKANFIAAFRQNLTVWTDTSLPLTVSDEWRDGLQYGGRALLSVLDPS